MAHGIGGIKAAGLAPFAERFADDGYLAVVFDYRHWGASSGHPRQLLSVTRQRQDYRTVLSWVRSHHATDPDRVFAWGTSLAGMHIVELAASEDGLAGAIAQVPLVDSLAVLTRISPLRGLRLTLAGVMDLLGARIGRAPGYLPISVPPGNFGLIATEDAMRRTLRRLRWRSRPREHPPGRGRLPEPALPAASAGRYLRVTAWCQRCALGPGVRA
jgi:fermentation-respiration switch protein FrsA (DUF1100 family)